MSIEVAANASEGDKFAQLNAAAGAPAGKSTEFISFAIGDDQYGVDIMAVREIKGWTEITHLPKQPVMSAVSLTCAVSSFRSSICAVGSVKV